MFLDLVEWTLTLFKDEQQNVNIGCRAVLKEQRAALNARAGIIESVNLPNSFPWTVHARNNASGIVFKVQDIRAGEKALRTAPYSQLHR